MLRCTESGSKCHHESCEANCKRISIRTSKISIISVIHSRADSQSNEPYIHGADVTSVGEYGEFCGCTSSPYTGLGKTIQAFGYA